MKLKKRKNEKANWKTAQPSTGYSTYPIYIYISGNLYPQSSEVSDGMNPAETSHVACPRSGLVGDIMTWTCSMYMISITLFSRPLRDK